MSNELFKPKTDWSMPPTSEAPALSPQKKQVLMLAGIGVVSLASVVTVGGIAVNQYQQPRGEQVIVSDTAPPIAATGKVVDQARADLINAAEALRKRVTDVEIPAAANGGERRRAELLEAISEFVGDLVYAESPRAIERRKLRLTGLTESVEQFEARTREIQQRADELAAERATIVEQIEELD